jgi:Protein of unknown function (DUF3047)
MITVAARVRIFAVCASTFATAMRSTDPACARLPLVRDTAADSIALLHLDSLPSRQTLPREWAVRPVRGERAPQLEVIDSEGARSLRISGVDRAAWLVRELATPIAPDAGSLSWRWRVLEHPRGADLRKRDADDAALRVFVAFERANRFDRAPHTLFYSSGTVEEATYQRRSFQSSNMHVIRMGGGGTVGQWLRTSVDPFADYARVWGGKARAIVAIGIMQDSDETMSNATADVGALVWHSGIAGRAAAGVAPRPTYLPRDTGRTIARAGAPSCPATFIGRMMRS